MKKIFFILLAPLLFSFNTQHAATELIFKTQMKAGKKYSQTIEQSSANEIKYIASKEFLQRIKDKGIDNPTLSSTHSITEAIVKTGKIGSDNNFPVTMEFVKTTSSDGKKSVPDGTILYGHATTTTMPKFDSIVSPDMDAKLKSTMLKAIESTFEQLSFPERKVKVGETFMVKTPLTIPIAGVNVEMDIVTKYKLLSIKNGIGDFDVAQTYIMKLNFSQYEMKGKGSGKGKLLYDIANSYSTKYQTDIDMRMYLKLEDFALDLKMKSQYNQTVVISEN